MTNSGPRFDIRSLANDLDVAGDVGGPFGYSYHSDSVSESEHVIATEYNDDGTVDKRFKIEFIVEQIEGERD